MGTKEQGFPNSDDMRFLPSAKSAPYEILSLASACIGNTGHMRVRVYEVVRQLYFNNEDDHLRTPEIRTLRKLWDRIRRIGFNILHPRNVYGIYMS